jgi:hypothetical protein
MLCGPEASQEFLAGNRTSRPAILIEIRRLNTGIASYYALQKVLMPGTFRKRVCSICAAIIFFDFL